MSTKLQQVQSVVAQAVQGDAVKNITVPEIQQLVTFVEKTGFQDFAAHDMNMLRDKKTNKRYCEKYFGHEGYCYCNTTKTQNK